MIEYRTGDLFLAGTAAIVNPVNCVGVMGAGLAAQFKRAYPDNFHAYAEACRRGDVAPGKMFLFQTGFFTAPSLIVNFPTKRHWRDKSRLEDIELGLTALVTDVQRHAVQSIAIPPLGCGLGGLEWAQVKPLIEVAFTDGPTQVVVFQPR